MATDVRLRSPHRPASHREQQVAEVRQGRAAALGRRHGLRLPRAGGSRAARARRARRVRLRVRGAGVLRGGRGAASRAATAGASAPEAVVLLPGRDRGPQHGGAHLRLAGRRAPRAGARLPAHPALPGQHGPHPRRGAARAPRRRPLRGGLGGVRARHHAADPRLHPLQPAQSHRPRLHARGAGADGGDLPAAERRGSSPTRSTAISSTRGSGTCPSPPSAPKWQARTDHPHVAVQDVQPRRPQVRHRGGHRRRASARSSSPPRWTWWRTPTSSASPPRTPPIATAVPWLDALMRLSRGQPRLHGGVRARALPRRRGPSARRRCTSPGSTSGGPDFPATIPSPSSSTRRAWRSTTASPSAPAARASRGSTSAVPAPCSPRASIACGTPSAVGPADRRPRVGAGCRAPARVLGCAGHRGPASRPCHPGQRRP